MKKVKLKDIAQIQTGPFGSQLHSKDYVAVGTPIVTVEHLGNRLFTHQNLPRVSEFDKHRLQKYLLEEGDIVFSRVGSVDRCSYVDKEHTGWLFSGRCLRIRSLPSIEPLYLYYFLCLESTKRFIKSIAVGATMPSINTKILGEVEIALPSIDRQKNISYQLLIIDRKIEINNQINDNLSATAKLLIQNFRKETLKSPKKYVPLSEIATFENGYSYKSTELQASSVAMATIGNFTRNGEFKNEGFKEIVIGKKIRSSQYIVEGDIVVAHTDVTQAADIIGRAVQILDLSGYAQAIFSCDLVKVIPMVGYSHSFIAALLSSREFHEHCKGYTNGTTVLHLGKTALPQYIVTLPEDKMKIEELSRSLEKITYLRSILLKENRTLSTTRDTLLRKFIRG